MNHRLPMKLENIPVELELTSEVPVTLFVAALDRAFDFKRELKLNALGFAENRRGYFNTEMEKKIGNQPSGSISLEKS